MTLEERKELIANDEGETIWRSQQDLYTLNIRVQYERLSF